MCAGFGQILFLFFAKSSDRPLLGSTSVQWERRGRGGGLPLTGTHQQLVDLPPEPQSVQPTWTLDFFPLLSLFSKVACFGKREGLSLLRLFSLGESFWSGKQACWPLEHDPIVANGKHV